MTHKTFKVASISSNANSFGLHGHVLMAEDGETWQVGRSRVGGYPEPWQIGQVIEVPLATDPVRGITSPDWKELHCETPQRLPDAPTNVVAELWGKPVEAEAEPGTQREVTPSIVFTAEQFTPMQGSSAQEKANFANSFVRFVENGFHLRHFTDGFYGRLSQTFGHVAHFDQATFYRTFFTTSVDRLGFLKKTVEHEPVGDPAFTYSDVERVLRDWIIASGLMDRVVKTAAHAQSRAEREQLRRLLDKHGGPGE